MQEFAIRSRRVVTSAGLRDSAVVVRNGKIADVCPPEQIPLRIPVKDFGNLVVMPGLVDTHVHINEPGRTDWEGFETATKAAAAGGITTLVDMPLNSSPVTTTLDAFHKKLVSTRGKLWVDCGFYAGLIPGNNKDLRLLIDAGVLGFKAFLIDSGIDEFPNVTEKDLRAGMPTIAASGLPLLVHCELHTTSNIPTLQQSKLKDYPSFLSSRPPQWEHDAIDLMISLCKEFRCRTHIVHLSSANGAEILSKARAEGLPLTVETCPHYLFFSSEDIPDRDTRFKCTPPIRERENRERLWKALEEGTIDFIVSDHSPATPEMKLLGEGDFHRSWGGIASLQFGLSIVWTEAKSRGFTFENLTQWMSSRPASLVGLTSKGSIEVGFDADFVVWDPESSFKVKPSIIQHRHKITPYEGKTLFGVVKKTFVRGTEVFDSGTLTKDPAGVVILRGRHSR